MLVPVQQLDPVAAAIAKDKDVAGQRVGLQMLPHQFRQAVEALAQVGGLHTHGVPKVDGVGQEITPVLELIVMPLGTELV